MNRLDLGLMIEYNEWANEKVLAACRAMPAEALYAPRACSFGSLLGTMVHIYAAERAWRLRLQDGISPKKLASVTDFDTLEELEEAWRDETAKTKAYVAGLDDATMDSWVTFTTTTGWPQGSTLWKALLNMVMHGVQFRAEAGMLLGGLNCSPGDLDLVFYLRETDQR